MQVSVTGHQKREGLDWDWVADQLRGELSRLQPVTKAFSSLAVGSDQMFARTAMSLGIPHVAVIPTLAYERFFSGEGLTEYRRLLASSEIVQLAGSENDEQSFFDAGKFVVDHCDVLFAVWDGQRAKGLGGTADIVVYASKLSKRVIHFNPITFDVINIGGNGNGGED
ncbi:hypothetical protein JQ636_11310 [Bradyrhizobium japonicum]|uniref:hypothetical protein n=1 Tax=Bradyrhizobium japonicum TaxID=375 RepID=UPI001BA753A4|nr:hypothetical protein [Bradyrhizobium japonicum]MBR0804128.1 hypothetical protein [Bradyrhizobium japonicum]